MQPGDTVRFLNAVGGGTVTRIDGAMAYVEDQDGFETPVLCRECVVVAKAADKPVPQQTAVPSKPSDGKPSVQPRTANTKDSTRQPGPDEIAETPGGDSLNIVLGFEPDDVRRLSETAHQLSLVNDSNYYLDFQILTRDNMNVGAGGAESGWTLLYAGTVEPNIQLTLGTFDAAEVGKFDGLALQYTAYKTGGPFVLKPPVLVRVAVDTTRFFKLHCFKNNPYFDNPVIAIDMVRDDKPVSRNTLSVDAEQLQKAMQQKIKADRRPVRRPQKPRTDLSGNLVVDLHIHQLTDTTRGLSNADILNMQVDKFRQVMDSQLSNRGRKIIFIHGKGEGVLRNALLKELAHRYKKHEVNDASFAEYGYGATQVTIR